MDKKKKLKHLMEKNGIIVLAGVHDALSARIAQDVGFQGIAMSGNGAMASLLGRPDLSLATMTEMTGRARQIASCVDIPMMSDGDSGYGGLNNIRRTVEEFETAGVSAISLEDQITQKRCGELGGVELVSAKEHADRIRIAVKSRKDPDFMIIARTDAKAVYGLNAAIERSCAYAEAGADMVWVEGLHSLDEIKTVVNNVGVPVFYNIYEDSPEHCYQICELEDAGVKMTMNCLTSTLCAAKTLKEIYKEFYLTGTTRNVAKDMMDMKEYTRILGIERETRINELLND